MAMFKVGDRVRCIEDQSGRGRGCLGVVIEAFDKSANVEFDAPFDGWGESGRMWAVTNDRLELGTEKAKPAYKVGDHVVGKNNIGDPVNGLVDMVDDEDEQQPYCVDGWWCYAKDLQLAETQPAPLTIRAGGYYKTRDGRKVGPMIRTESLAYDTRETLLFGDVDRQQKLFRKADGRHLFGEKGLDLVAEWPAEKGCAAAQVDVQREEYGAPAAAAKFKVGDVVRFLRDNPDGGVRYGAKGALARVTKLRGRAGFSGSDIDVTPIGWECDIDPGVPSSAVELAPTSTAPAIVALIEGGQPKPATRPYVHANRDLAAKEAGRLAGVHKGQEFGVYELVTTRKVERTYEHEWQRLAAAGELILAIKELRRITGMGLKPAKDAVVYFREAA